MDSSHTDDGKGVGGDAALESSEKGCASFYVCKVFHDGDVIILVPNPSLAASSRRRRITLHISCQLCYAGLDTSHARLDSYVWLVLLPSQGDRD